MANSCLTSPVGEGTGSATGGAHWTPGSLHIEEERRRPAALRQQPLPLLGVLLGLLAVLAPDGEGEGPEALLGDFLAAVEAVAVVALLEPRECVVDLVQRLRLHLDQRKLDVLLDVGLGALDRRSEEHTSELQSHSDLV